MIFIKNKKIKFELNIIQVGIFGFFSTFLCEHYKADCRMKFSPDYVRNLIINRLHNLDEGKRKYLIEIFLV